MKLSAAAALVETGCEKTFSYYAFPSEHKRSLRTNNPLERLMPEIRRRTRAVGAFVGGKRTLNLGADRLHHVVGTRWGCERYMYSGRIREIDQPITTVQPA